MTKASMVAEGKVEVGCLRTLEEACSFLRMSMVKLYAMMNNGTLPFVKIGHSCRIRQSDLEALIERLVSTSKAAA